MALKIMVQYRELSIIYDVTEQDSDIYQLKLHGDKVPSGDNYVPQKMVIRKKGKIWISDAEDYPELVTSLTKEISQFRTETEI